MRAPALAFALVASSAFGTADAQTLGAPPPELKAVKWYNTPPLTLEDLRGKAVLVEVFRTW